MLTKEQAEAAAKVLTDALGPGWTAGIHENCGWYAVAKCGPVAVFAPSNADGTYLAMIGEGGGAMITHRIDESWSGHGATPIAALHVAIQAAQADVNERWTLLKQAEVAAGVPRVGG